MALTYGIVAQIAITVQHPLKHPRQISYTVVKAEKRTYTQAKSAFWSLKKTFLLLGIANLSQLPMRRHVLSVTKLATTTIPSDKKHLSDGVTFPQGTLPCHCSFPSSVKKLLLLFVILSSSLLSCPSIFLSRSPPQFKLNLLPLSG